MRIPGVAVVISGDYSQLKQDLNAAKAIVRQEAAGIADSMNNALSPKQVENALSGLTDNLSKVAHRASAAGTDFSGLGASLGELTKATGLSESGLRQLQQRVLEQKAINEAERAFASLGKAAGMSTLELATFRIKSGDVEGGVRMLGSVVMSAVPYVAAIGLAAGAAAKACFDAAMAADRLTKAYTTITGSTAGAKDQLQFLYDVSNRLGLQFQSTAAAAKGFFAAGKGTSLEADLRNIFTAVSQAGASLALGQEEMNGIFMALGQMISKGKVQAEELRGQLGERLPGAFQLAAKAMGVTTAELDKMLESGKVTADELLPKLARVLREEYAGAASDSVAAVNRLSTEWERFKSSVMDTQGMVIAIGAVADALKGATDAMASQREWAATIDEMRRLGIGESVLGVGQTGYTQDQIDAFRNRRTAGYRQRDGAFADQTANSVYLERVTGAARTAATAFLKDTDATKAKKINEEAADAIRKLTAARDADLENAQQYSQQIAAVEAERADKLKKLTKDSVSEQNKVSDAMREVHEEVLRLTGNDVALAQEQFEQKFVKLQRAIGRVTPEMKLWRDEAQKAFALGMTAEQYHSATKRWNEQASERTAELGVYRASVGSGKLDAVEMERVRGMAAIEKWKQGDEWKAASVQQRAGEEAKARELVELKSQQRIEEINVQFLGKAASTFKGRTDLQERVLKQEYDTYSKHVRDKELLDAWYEEQRLRLSRNAIDGLKRGFRDYADDAMNAAKNMEGIVTGAFKSMEDALVSFVTKGKMDFSSFVDSVVADIARAQIRQNITGPLASALGGFNFGKLFGFGNHTGGIAGSEATFARAVPAGVYTHAPRYHTGGIAGDEVPAILKRGEGVFTQEQMRALSPASSAPAKVEVRIFNESGKQMQAAQADARFDLDKLVIGIVLNGFQNDTMGMRRILAGGA